jgi:hypothetical protein
LASYICHNPLCSSNLRPHDPCDFGDQHRGHDQQRRDLKQHGHLPLRFRARSSRHSQTINQTHAAVAIITSAMTPMPIWSISQSSRLPARPSADVVYARSQALASHPRRPGRRASMAPPWRGLDGSQEMSKTRAPADSPGNRENPA